MELLGQIPIQWMLFFILFGITGVVPLIAALYLLLRRSNAIAPGVTPPERLRRWTAAFFVVASLTHVWWFLFYVYSGDQKSVAFMVIVMLDCVTLFTTFAGTLLSMLQNRRRSMWPVLIAMIPFLLLWGAYMVDPNQLIEQIVIVYLMLVVLLFTVYMVVAIRQYGQWLNDNYADLENKKVWLCQMVALVCMLLFVLYVFATDMVYIWLVHIISLVLVGLLLWRVETLPSLSPDPSPKERGVYSSSAENSADKGNHSPLRGVGGEAAVTINLEQIERLLKERCVAPQLYLKHDLSLSELAQAVGTNRFYLSQYFSRQGITYNTYINNLRINHFISRYQELASTGQPVGAQELAYESGFGSYRTFSRAFTERMGQSVTEWMRQSAG